MLFWLISPAVLPSGFAPTYFQNILKGLHHKTGAEDLLLSTYQVQWLQDSPEINTCLSTECYFVILTFPHIYIYIYIKAHRVTCQTAAAEWCLSQEAEGTRTVAGTCCDARLDGLIYWTQIHKKKKKKRKIQITKGALLFIENVKIM